MEFIMLLSKLLFVWLNKILYFVSKKLQAFNLYFSVHCIELNCCREKTKPSIDEVDGSKGQWM
jgi:hypothetical protein